jgi:hypothetical protein
VEALSKVAVDGWPVGVSVVPPVPSLPEQDKKRAEKNKIKVIL